MNRTNERNRINVFMLLKYQQNHHRHQTKKAKEVLPNLHQRSQMDFSSEKDYTQTINCCLNNSVPAVHGDPSLKQ